jgi:transglutaminase-like putative cysteine protease
MLLAQQLHAMLGRVERPEGEPLAPEETLRRGEASCRDQTLLFMETCRSLGYAARFVSGYYYAGPESDDHELHAWAELYLPGGGWRGFDPTSGLAAGEAHIAIAAAIQPRMAAPVSGSIRGRGSSSLHTHVALEQVSEDTGVQRGA